MNSDGACKMRSVFISPAVSGDTWRGGCRRKPLFIVFVKAMRKTNMKK